MPITRRGALALFAALPLIGRAAPASTLMRATDLHTDGMLAAQQRTPLVILFTLPGCPHCEVVRRSHLLPMQRDTPTRAIIREIDTQSSARLIGFDGQPTTHELFAKDKQVRLAPTVAFYGANGATLTKSLTGAMLPDFYAHYLDTALDNATARLHTAQIQQS
jgi:thioredoxin-related protein